MSDDEIKEYRFSKIADIKVECHACEDPIPADERWWTTTAPDYDLECWCRKCVEELIEEDKRTAAENEAWGEKHLPSIEVLKTFVQPNNPNPERYGD